jgi:hypothetical protein
MSIRITENMRIAITQRLLDHRFDKEHKALKQRENDLALKFYRAIYSAPARKAMEAVPPGWMPTTHRIRISVNGNYSVLHTADAVPVPFTDQQQIHPINKIKGGEALAEALDAHLRAAAGYERERKAVRDKTNGALAGFGTIASLLKAWPEVKPFVDQLGFNESAKSLPAAIPADLNTSLGLATA